MISKIKQVLVQLDRTAELYILHIVEIIECESHSKNEP
jgi:hypothetical protein